MSFSFKRNCPVRLLYYILWLLTTASSFVWLATVLVLIMLESAWRSTAAFHADTLPSVLIKLLINNKFSNTLTRRQCL